jgi:hypothetical protein
MGARMKPPRLLPALLVALACSGAGTALAQNASDKAAAEALFREGRKLYEAGQFPTACAKFAESQRLDPAPGTLLNLGGCYEKNGQTASAWATFKEAVSAAHVKGRTDWEDLARTRAQALEPNLSRLTITVSATADGLKVLRDGVAVGQAEWGTAIPVDPGTHVVEAQAAGRRSFRQSIDVTGSGANASVTVTELAVDSGGGPGAQGSDGSTQRTIGLVVGGVGIVALGVGSAFGVVAMNKENDATHSSHCPDGVHCDGYGLQLGQDAHTDATASTVLFVVGGAAVAGGLVLYFTAPKGDIGVPAVGLRASPTRGGAAFGLEGSW